MKNVELSEIVRTCSAWRWFFPVQSVGQFASFFSLCAACILALAIVLMNLDPGAPLPYVLIPAALGCTSPLFAVLPGRFVIRTGAGGNVSRTVEAALVRLGYMRSETAATEIRYRAALPGWLHWKENEFSLSVSANAITVSGPIYPLRALRYRLSHNKSPVRPEERR
jgi:hypothetical protein